MAFTYALMVLAACLAGCGLYCLFLLGRHLYRLRDTLSVMVPGPNPQVHHEVFDASAVAPEVARVRANYLQALRSRPHPLTHSAALVLAARRALVGSGYFEARQLPEDALDQ